MSKSTLWFSLIGCVLVLTGVSCLDSGDTATTARVTENVSGRWVGLTSQNEDVILDLDQTLTAVTGTAQIGDFNSSITGTIDGDRLEATLPTQPIRQIFATVTSTRIGGTIRDFQAEILSTFDATLQ